jgi:formylglycine-generating enzyme required for sulfatase activity
MANQNHLEILFPGWTEGKNYTESDRVAWNKWRSQNPSVVPDLSGLSFKNRLISKIDFSGAILTDTRFDSMVLDGIDFSDSDLRRADFSGATLINVNLEGAKLSGARVDRHTKYNGVKGIRRGVNGIYSESSDSSALMEIIPPGDSMAGTNISIIVDNLKTARKYLTISFSLAFLFIVVNWIPKTPPPKTSNPEEICRKVNEETSRKVKLPLFSEDISVEYLVPVSLLISAVMLLLTVLILKNVYQFVQYIKKREDAMAIGHFPWPLTSYTKGRLYGGLSILIRLFMCFHPLIYWSKVSYPFSGWTNWSTLAMIAGCLLLTTISAALFYISQLFQRPILFDPTLEKLQLSEMQQIVKSTMDQTRSIQRLVSTIERSSLVTTSNTQESQTFELPGATPLVMVGIPDGQFLMGSPIDEYGRFANEGPQHLVKVKAFQMCQYPVTQAQWRAVMGKLPEGLDKLDARFHGDLLPVVMVSWNDVQEFIKKLREKLKDDNFRLPSEAEWEYAARAGTTTPFFFGDQITPEIVNYDGRSPYRDGEVGKFRGHPVAVGSLGIPNEWGLYDVHGNVWEWCEDEWHDDYSGGYAPTDGRPWVPAVGRAAYRVIRGGGWHYGAVSCRSAYRVRGTPGSRHDDVGFRLSRTLPLALLPLRAE